MATIYFRNSHASAQDRHTTFVVPSSVSTTLGEYAEMSNGGTAVRCEDDGHSALYCARAAWATGRNAVTASALGSNPGWYFEFHEGFGSSDCGSTVEIDPRNIPTVTLVTTTGQRIDIAPTLRTQTPRTVIDSPRMKRLVWESHHQGHHVEYVMDLFHLDAVAQIGMYYSWSDDQDTRWRLPATHLEWAFGHEVKPYFQVMQGLTLSNSNQTVTLPFTFTTSATSGREWGDWGDNVMHGARICLHAWMFGRPRSGTISADETVFSRCTFLEGVADATTWAGGYSVTGKVPPVPTNRDVVRPDYATAAHYVTADYGYGGSDETGSQGLCCARYNNQQGLQGAIGLIAGGQVIHGDQPAYDFLAGSLRWALEPTYRFRDGTFTQYGYLNYRFALRHVFPVSNSLPWGAKVGTGWLWPTGSGQTNHGIFDEHHTLNTPAAAYELTHDYLTYLILRDTIKTWMLNDRRNLSIGSPVSGDRMPGRWIIAVLAARASCPSLANDVDDLVMSSRGGIFAEWRRTMSLSPTHQDGLTALAYHSSQSPEITGPDGLTWNRYTDPIFAAKGLISLYWIYLIYGVQDALDIFHRVGTSTLRRDMVVTPTSGSVGTLLPGPHLGYQMMTGPSQWNGAGIPVGYRTEPNARFYGNTGNASTAIAYPAGRALTRWGCGFLKLYANIGTDAAARSIASQAYALDLTSSAPHGWMNAHQEAVSGY